ncbi:MAG: NADH-quinone oxidoreductase subunit F [Actinomycetota bacterium]|nr:NADH-quinone oxidoreductase subunit F [Actinomycetota bacterium]
MRRTETERQTGFLLPGEPLTSLDDYRELGGGEGLRLAYEMGPQAVAEEVRAAGLRGRGGAGFPTGIKWQGLQKQDSDTKYLVCNAAEGEPGTFKDRILIRRNPYQLLEGIAIAAFAVGAYEAYVGLKERFDTEVEALERAADAMHQADMLGEVPINVVQGPDNYLLGEEKGLLEAIEGKDPLPRLYPPYVMGLFADQVLGVGAGTVGAGGATSNPTVVNNAETLSNVPHILRNGADWFRSFGTPESPGTMVFTICGDVRTEGVHELPLGTPLSVLVYGVGGGLEAGRRLKMAVSGVANRPLVPRQVDTPLAYESMGAAGSWLGAGGYIVYDDTACAVRVGAVLSRFNALESCGQCPPCKLGSENLTDRLEALEAGQADLSDLEEMGAWVGQVTDANRCGLGQGEQNLVSGLLEHYWEEVESHLYGPCPSNRPIVLPKITDYDPARSRFVYDLDYFERRPSYR